MASLTTSIFDLFKIGPGPSSSHTIGPMLAGNNFIRAVQALPQSVRRRARSAEVRLFGSLSATGKGHGTDRAALAGPATDRPGGRTLESRYANDPSLIQAFELPIEKQSFMRYFA